MDFNKIASLFTGWLCPECETVYSPNVKSCDCKEKEKVLKDWTYSSEIEDGNLIQYLRHNHSEIFLITAVYMSKEEFIERYWRYCRQYIAETQIPKP